MSDDFSAWRRTDVESEGLSEEVSYELNSMSNRILKALIALAVLVSLSLGLNAYLFSQLRSVQSDLRSTENMLDYVGSKADDTSTDLGNLEWEVGNVDTRVDNVCDFLREYFWNC